MSQPTPIIKDATEETANPRPMSAGEKIFDSVVYGPMNFFGTLFVGALIAYYMEYGKTGEKIFDASTRWLKKIGIDKRTAYDITKTNALFLGGNTMLIPVRAAEAYKVPIADALNKATGDKTDRREIDAKPKQTWGSLIPARIIAYVIVLTGFRTAAKFFGAQFTAFEEWFGRQTVALFKTTTHRAPGAGEEAAGTLLSRAAELAKELLPFQEKVKANTITAEETTLYKTLEEKVEALRKTAKQMETKPYAYGKILSLDIFATVLAVALLYIGSRALVQKREPKQHAPHRANEIRIAADDTSNEMAESKETHIKVKEHPTPKRTIEAATAQAEKPLAAALQVQA